MESALTCPQCQKPIREGQKFCTYCRFRLAAEDPEHPVAPPPMPLSERWRAPAPPRAPREIGFELALALAALARPAEALEALESAARENGAQPSAADFHFQKGRIAEAADDLALAFLSYLEAARREPSQLVLVLDHLHGWLRPEIVQTHGRWVTGEWAKAVGALALDAKQRLRVALFVGHVQLFLGKTSQALMKFAEAARVSSTDARALAQRLIFGSRLPPALAVAKDGPARFTLAQIHHAFGNEEVALEQAERALQGEFPTENYPDAPVYEFKGRLLAAAGQTEEAAQCFYEAGRRFNWRNELPRSRRLLRRAVKLRPRHAPSHWFLADTLRLLDKEESARVACEVWDRAAAELGLPTVEFAWAYTVRALLNEQLVSLASPDPQTVWRLFCQAAAWLECGLLLNPDGSQIWAHLGQFLSYLNFDHNAAAATRRALELDEESLLALDVHAMNSIYIGDFVGAEKTSDRRQALEGAEIPDYRKIWALMLQHRYKPALELLRPVIKQLPEEIIYRELRAGCLERSGRAEAARTDWEEVLRFYSAAKLPVFSAGLAAYKLGRWSEATEWFERLREVTVETPGRASRYLGLTRLATGDWDRGAEHLAAGISEATAAWELKEFLEFDFQPFLRASVDGTDAVRKVLNELKRQIRDRIRELTKHPPDAMQELHAALERLHRTGRLESIDAVVVHAVLARQLAAAEQWGEAARIYRELLRRDGDFPEARRGWVSALEKLSDDGAARLRAEQPDEALAECLLPAQELARDAGASEEPLLAKLTAEIGFARFLQCDRMAASKQFAAALERQRRPDAAHAGQWLGELCRMLLASGTRYWAIDDFWREWCDSPIVDEPLRRDLAAARQALAEFLPTRYGLSPKAVDAASSSQLMVTPVVVEMDMGLVPADTDDWPLLTQHVPKMSDRILATTGVTVPGVRFRGNEGNLSSGAYILMLDEVPLEIGIIERLAADASPSGWMRFSPQPTDSLRAVGIPAEGLTNGTHPVTGTPGCWVAEPFWVQAETRGLELLPEPISYLVLHLETFLRQHLAEFLGVQAVAQWLERCAQQHAELVRDAVPDTAARLALGRLLRGLAQEDVPIVEAAAILEGFRETERGADLFVTLRAVRGRLKAQLPGNQPEVERFSLPPGVEAAVASALSGAGDKRCLAPSPEDTQDTLAKMLETLPPDRLGCVLVVGDPVLRPFVRRLAQLELPRLQVLAADELTQTTEVAHV